MPLTTRTNGSTPANIIAASWWNDYKDLLTGVMTDQAVDINNSVNVNSLITNYGSSYGYYIQDSFGAPQRAMHVHTDGDLHLIASPINNKLRITKNSYTYDIAVFDLSGTTGQTTLNGSLTLTGGAASLTCTTLTCTTLVAGAISPVSVTTGTVNATTVNTANLNVSGNQLNFTGGNTGAIRNPAGGPLDISAGGSAGVYFYNLTFGTLLAGLSSTGVLSLSGVTASGTINAATLNVSGNQINFTGSNNGAIRNPTGGALEVTAGGSAGINFFTNSFGTGLGGINNAGVLSLSGVSASGTINAATLTATTVNTGSLNISGNQMNFTGGNNGAVRNTPGGALDVSAGGSATVNFYNLTFGTLLASISSAGVLSLSGVSASGTINTANLNVSGNQMNFSGGNNGAVRNPAGGAFEMTAGGSAGINFFTNSFGTGLGGIDRNGKLTMNTVDASVVHFTLGGLQKVAEGSFFATSGNSVNVSNPFGSAWVSMACTSTRNVFVWLSASTSSTNTFNWAGSTAPQSVLWFGWALG